MLSNHIVFCLPFAFLPLIFLPVLPMHFYHHLLLICVQHMRVSVVLFLSRIVVLFSDSFHHICVRNLVFPSDFQHSSIAPLFKSLYSFHFHSWIVGLNNNTIIMMDCGVSRAAEQFWCRQQCVDSCQVRWSDAAADEAGRQFIQRRICQPAATEQWRVPGVCTRLHCRWCECSIVLVSLESHGREQETQLSLIKPIVLRTTYGIAAEPN